MRKLNSKLLIKDIVLDEEIYPRNQYFWQVAYDYSESMKTGVKFPKIAVAKVGNAFILVDGKHRLEAYKILKQKSIAVEVLIGLNKKQIFEEAVKRNIAHGKTLSVQEKLSVALKFRDMNYTLDKVSKLIQIPVGKLKDLLSRRLFNSITGEEIVLKRPFEDISRSASNDMAKEDIEMAQKEFFGRKQEAVISELIVLIETKAINLKNKKVFAKLRKLKSLLNGVKLK